MCDIRREEFRLALGASRLRASHYPPTKEHCGVRFSVYCQMSNLVLPGEKFRIPAAESFRKQVELEVQNAMMAARFQHFFPPLDTFLSCAPCPCFCSQWVVVGANPCRKVGLMIIESTTVSTETSMSPRRFSQKRRCCQALQSSRRRRSVEPCFHWLWTSQMSTNISSCTRQRVPFSRKFSFPSAALPTAFSF